MKRVLSLIAFSIIAAFAQEGQQQMYPQQQQQVYPQQQQQVYPQQQQQVYPQQQQQVYPQQQQQVYPQQQQQVYPQQQQQVYPQQQQQVYPQQQQQSVTQEQLQQKKKEGFGARVNLGYVGVSSDNYKDADGGFAFGVGAFLHKELGFALLNIGASIVFKTTFSISSKDTDTYGNTTINITEEQNASEIALEIPVLFRYPINEQIYLEAGPQINLAFSPEIEWSYDDGTEKESRSGDMTIEISLTLE